MTPKIYRPKVQAGVAPPAYQPQPADNTGKQFKNALSLALERRLAPPVYRPAQNAGPGVQLTVGKSLQLDTRPAPSVYRPQPIKPKVAIQQKATPPFSGCLRKAPMTLNLMPANSTTIQTASSAKWETEATATTKSGLKKKGKSGNGQQVGQLLRASGNPDATRFLNVLIWVTQNTSGRSAFTCAEPHAVAQILSSSTTVLEDITIETAYDSFGGKDTCPVCSKWIDSGKFVDPQPAPVAPVAASAPAPAQAPLKPPSSVRGSAAFDRDFPPLGQ